MGGARIAAEVGMLREFSVLLMLGEGSVARGESTEARSAPAAGVEFEIVAEEEMPY